MGKNDSIRLHPEHGLNPTISQCMYCGKDKNELALLGAGYKERAPMHMVLDIEPCDSCKEKYAGEGVFVVELEWSEHNHGNPPKGTPPTGRFFCIKDEALIRLIGPDADLSRRIVTVSKEAFDKFLSFMPPEESGTVPEE